MTIEQVRELRKQGKTVERCPVCGDFHIAGNYQKFLEQVRRCEEMELADFRRETIALQRNWTV